MVRRAPLSTDYREVPYWWDVVDRAPMVPTPLESSVDVVVVGGGNTGLAAAWEIARAGRSVLVVDRDDMASGASSRNGGMVHAGGKRDVGEFLRQPEGRQLWDDTVRAYQGVPDLATELGIDIDWQPSGHVELAHHRRAATHQRALVDRYASIGEAARFVEGDELAAEIGSSRFLAGVVVARGAGVHPAKLAWGLMDAAGAAGARLHEATAVLSVERAPGGYTVDTSRGAVRCRDVVVATNGTTDHRLVPWLGRRVVGVGSYMIATDTLDPDLPKAVNPCGRMFFDSRNFLNYWRLSPDGTRLLFGGRTSLAPTTVTRSRDQLYAAMVRVHPQLAGVRVARAWGGQVGLTADRFPHVGRHPQSGVVYALGYNGSGVALSIHFGRAVGRWLCGEGDLPPFAVRRFAPVPWPGRTQWLQPAAGWWFRACDALGR